jgi:hypothetical protein
MNEKENMKTPLLIILVIGVIISVALSAASLVTLVSYIAGQEAEEEVSDETTEDYVTIADNYEIKPTTNISDAYKSDDTSELSDKEKETLDMAKSALDEMGIKDSMSDYEKEKAVYDWMTSALSQDTGALTVIPTTTEDCDNPYGVLKYHNAVCVGYATTFRLFMQMMDIECMVEHNTELYHSWDLVKLDGDWYITDVYSDAGNGNYSHFNMTDSIWGQDQNWDHDFFPAANSLKYNYSYMNRKTVDSVYDIPAALREAMDAQMGSVMIEFKEEITEEKAQIASYAASSIDEQLMANTYENMPYTLGTYRWVQNPDDNKYLFSVAFGMYNTTDQGTELTDKQREKIEKKVEKALDGLSSGSSSMTYDPEMGGTDVTEGVSAEETSTSVTNATDDIATTIDPDKVGVDIYDK